MRSTATNVLGTVVEKPVRLGARGFVIGIQITPDGATQLCWTDAGGAYYRTGGRGSEWLLLNNSAALPATAYDPRPANGALTDGEGCFTAAFAPSRAQRIIMSWDALLYYSDDAGASFVKLPLPAKRMLSNSNHGRLFNRRSAFHPTDPNSYIVATTADGVYFSTNVQQGATATFTQVNGIPNPTATMLGSLLPLLVAFDPGQPNNVMIFSWGNGLYRSTTGLGAAAFSLVPGGPTTASTMKFAPDGTLWVIEYGAVPPRLWKLPRGSSTWVQAASFNILQALGIDPDGNKLYPFGDNGELRRSIDGGATFSQTWFLAYPAPIGIYQNADAIPHLGGLNASITIGDIEVDTSGRLWASHGMGVSWSDPPAGFDRWDWTDDSRGIEELVPKRVLTMPGNPRTLFGTMDASIMPSVDPDRFVAVPRFPNGQNRRQVDHCWDMDYAGADPDYVVNVCNGEHQIHGHSFDGGATWSVFEAQHPDGPIEGGACAVTNPGWIILVPGNNDKAVYSKDFGRTWLPVVLPGGSANGSRNWINSKYDQRYCVAAAKDAPGVAYAVTSTNHDQGAGLWRTPDGGATWTKQFNGVIDTSGDPGQFYHCTIRPVPGHAGELLYTCGKDFANNRLMRSTDAGVTWAAVRSAEIRDVRSFDYGKNYSGAPYPALFLHCRVNGVLGYYVSFDWLATLPRLLTRFPTGTVTRPNNVYGDANRIGRCYIGLDGQGYRYVDIVDTVDGS